MTQICDDCGGPVIQAIEESSFLYGVEPHTVNLTAMIPVWRCSICGSAFVDCDGMAARDAAVQRHVDGA